MKKTILAAPLAALLLFSGCGKDARAPEEASALYTGARVTAEAEISVLAEYPADYGVAVEWADGTAAVELTAPADIAGIKASLNGESAQITYDGAALECFLPAYPGYAPVDVLPRMMEQIAKSTPEEWCSEDYEGTPALSLTYRDDFAPVTGLRRVWLKESDLSLLAAELFLDDSLVLRVRCTAFVLYPAE